MLKQSKGLPFLKKERRDRYSEERRRSGKITVAKDRHSTLENETDDVRRMVFENRTLEELADKPFYFICFNILCRTAGGNYIPNEVGISKYSLRQGFEKHYHRFIDPGAIPLGYAYASQKHSNETHLIPTMGFELAKSDHMATYHGILDFINPTNKMVAPVFCSQESLEQNRGSLQWLSFRTGHSEGGPVQFYDITSLLMNLQAYAGRPFPSRAAAYDILNTSSYDYIPNTRCNYHEVLDNAYCALSNAKKLGFILSNTLCSLYHVDRIPKHSSPKVAGKIRMEKIQPRFQRPRLYISPKLSARYVDPSRVPSISSTTGDIDSTLNNSDTNRDLSWIKKFRQLQPDASTDSSQNDAKPVRCEEIRQPSTVPFVLLNALFQSKRQPSTVPFVLLNALFQSKRHVLHERGRQIERGNEPPAN